LLESESSHGISNWLGATSEGSLSINGYLTGTGYIEISLSRWIVLSFPKLTALALAFGSKPSNLIVLEYISGLSFELMWPATYLGTPSGKLSFKRWILSLSFPETWETLTFLSLYQFLSISTKLSYCIISTAKSCRASMRSLYFGNLSLGAFLAGFCSICSSVLLKGDILHLFYSVKAFPIFCYLIPPYLTLALSSS
jgi:hypothetical protein